MATKRENMKQVERHAKQYEAELKQLETTKHDLQQKSAELDRRFQEVQAMKKEAKQCQKKVEREFHDRMEVFLKDKANLETQKQNVVIFFSIHCASFVICMVVYIPVFNV